MRLKDRDGNDIDFNIYFEISSNTFFTTKKLSQIVKIGINGREKISLHRPIIINPRKMYEIRLEYSGINGCYHTFLWDSNDSIVRRKAYSKIPCKRNIITQLFGIQFKLQQSANKMGRIRGSVSYEMYHLKPDNRSDILKLCFFIQIQLF